MLTKYKLAWPELSVAKSEEPQQNGPTREICRLSGDTLDWTIIEAELTPLAMLKEQPEIMEKLFILRSQYQSNR